MTISVGETIPEGTFTYIPYAPELANTVRYTFVSHTPLPRYKSTWCMMFETNLACKLFTRAHVVFVRKRFLILSFKNPDNKTPVQLLRCPPKNGRIRKLFLSQSRELSLWVGRLSLFFFFSSIMMNEIFKPFFLFSSLLLIISLSSSRLAT